jgi:hypothetical protein
MATDAILFDLLDEARTIIQALDLPEMPAANVLIQKVASNDVRDLPQDKYPCVLIAPYAAETYDTNGAMNIRDDVVYSVGVWIIASDKIEDEQPGAAQEKDFRLYIKWRQSIRHAFHDQNPASHSWVSTVTPLDVVDRTWWHAKGVWISGMVVKFKCRENRA